ncbi:hypothetical protein FA95DRAFT_1585420 [Auriscalpium vulgare]|uniref:Uncharacterized protein n=1 Tax=Auriscalpium vulgare TaxID=40419 RepID=A0ACB8R5A3_9AGAM|nr:hypothetical protein FA95DRAFT_1585420 [Auriscalpium vulgare]
MIARCRSKCWVVQLREDNQELSLPNAQRGMKGHIIVYPQRPGELATMLPPPVDELITPICVLFVGSTPPTQEWLLQHAKPLAVRREKVRAALVWLKAHNPLYKDVTIAHEVLDGLQAEQILPVHVEHVLPSAAGDSLTARYDASESMTASLERSLQQSQSETPVTFQNVVITDVDGHAPSNELRAAAMRHVKHKGGAYVQIPHDPDPVNEFSHPALFPMIYPTLFPYGVGGFDDDRRLAKLSMKRQVKHLSITPSFSRPSTCSSAARCSSTQV